MKTKKILTLGMVTLLVVSFLGVGIAYVENAKDGDVVESEGDVSLENTKIQEIPQYVDHIRLEVRMDQSVGIGDTATGVLDAFLQSCSGMIIDGIPPEWKEELDLLDSYGGFNEFSYNTATTDGYGEVDTTGDGNVDSFNPLAIRDIRYATNWLISRQVIVENFYDGYGIAQYAAIGQTHPEWDEKFQQIIDEHGITYEGDFDKAYDMIQDAMNAAMEHDDILGELRKEGIFWEYRPPGGDWIDVEITGLIRIEDIRNIIGNWFSDLLEECGIKVNRIEGDNSIINIWLWTDAADMQWGFYTGGWMASAAVAYQHSTCAQMYTSWYPYMPGDAYYMYIDPGARYAYNRDDPAADELYNQAYKLMSGEIPDEDTYWVMFQDLLDMGLNESARVFFQTNLDFYPLNKNAVTDVAYDVVTGWSQIFSPRTIKTTDGNLKAAQFSSTGALYMDNWNNIGGFGCYYSVMQARMSRDFATTMNPITGVPIGMRAEFVEVIRDYEYDEYGDLQKNIPIPSDVVNYEVFEEEWTSGYGWTYSDNQGTIQVEEYAATAVEYKWHFGTWHSGHNFTMQDLVAYFAFGKQLCWLTDAGEHYHVGSWVNQRSYYNNILGIVFDEDNNTVTIYGDYTFPTDPQVAGYYMWMPEVPWQQYEAATQLIGLTDLAPGDPLNGRAYSWSGGEERNYVHWLSSAQGYDYYRTLQNMADAEFVPPYLSGDRNSPLPLDPGDAAGDIAHMRAFYDEYDHFWITHGPFKLTLHDPANLVVEFDRWTQADGYPFPPEYWDELIDESETYSLELSAGGEADGWNFVSFNLEMEDTDLEAILADIEGGYDRLMYFDASLDEWLSYVPGRAERFNNLQSWDHTMGIWIRMNENATLVVVGTIPVSTDITLYPGWNMVGLPSSAADNHGLPAVVTKVGYFHSSAEYNLVYDYDPLSFVFEPGQGYWVYNDAEEPVVWSVDY